MKKLIIIAIAILGIFATASAFAYVLSPSGNVNTNSIVGSHGMGSMMGSNMMSGMMSQIPGDVIVKVTSRQTVPTGKEAKITLLVLDKETKKPLSDAQVIIGIEKGASMTTMNMVGHMFKADDIGSGKYVVRFTPDSKGIYTMHTHVIPNDKSMHAMMENHLDIGIIAK